MLFGFQHVWKLYFLNIFTHTTSYFSCRDFIGWLLFEEWVKNRRGNGRKEGRFMIRLCPDCMNPNWNAPKQNYFGIICSCYRIKVVLKNMKYWERLWQQNVFMSVLVSALNSWMSQVKIFHFFLLWFSHFRSLTIKSLKKMDSLNC